MRLIIAVCLVALAVAVPPPQLVVNYNPNNVQLVRYDNENIGLGNYRFAYEQTDGQRHEAQGTLENEGKEDESISVIGSYAWVGPDGVTYIVRYLANKDGFQPEIEEGPGGAVPAGVLATLVGAG